MSSVNKLKQISKEKGKKERFIAYKMWADTALAMLRSDRGTIPNDIGNDVFVGNNTFITKNYITSAIIIEEYSVDTPISFSSILMSEIKEKVSDVIVDITYKSRPHEVDLTDYGLKSRVRRWEEAIEEDSPVPEKEKIRAAQLLYSYDVHRSGVSTYKTYTVIWIRAKTNHKIRSAQKIASRFLKATNIKHKIVKIEMPETMDFSLEAINDARGIKNFPINIMSSRTLAESLPITQGVNADKGVFMGIDRKNESAYYEDFKSSSRGKNLFVLAPSGSGKTFLVGFWNLNFLVNNYRLSIMDVKGNEYTEFAKAAGGTILSFSSESPTYVNTLTMDKDKARGSYTSYFGERFNFTKQLLTTICEVDERQEAMCESFIEEFLNSVYLQRGVLRENPNTWYRTKGLNPRSLYPYFTGFLSNDVIKTYSPIIDKIRMGFNTFINPKGSKSLIFETEYSLDSILDTPVICYDYGMLSSSGLMDATTMKIKTLYMSFINNEYKRHNKSLGLWTVQILEEVQVIDSFLWKMYKEEVTLRRAQNQITIILGNSISALEENKDAKAVLENITAVCIGDVTSTARDIIVKQFALEEYAEEIRALQTNPEYEHTFFFLNKSGKSRTAHLRAFVPERVRNNRVFKIVDEEVS